MRGVALGDQLPDQPPVESHHFLADVCQPHEEFLLLGARQCFQRQRGKVSVAGFCGIESRDNLFSTRTHVRILSPQQADT